MHGNRHHYPGGVKVDLRHENGPSGDFDVVDLMQVRLNAGKGERIQFLSSNVYNVSASRSCNGIDIDHRD